ncbi:hypothetical protein I4U23_006146 [Adineta vaga]|nr:hypothetical protein I4U23_006146 [Adineta vaga]
MRNQMQVYYSIIPIFVPFSMEIQSLSKLESSINISDDCCSFKELFHCIQEKEETIGRQLLPISLIDNKQIIDLTSNESISSLFNESHSIMIYIFQNTNTNIQTKQSTVFQKLSQRISNRNYVYTENNDINSSLNLP